MKHKPFKRILKWLISNYSPLLETEKLNSKILCNKHFIGQEKSNLNLY